MSVITNPLSAFGQKSGASAAQATIVEYEASEAIAKGTIVALTVTSDELTVAKTASAASVAIGVAVTATTAAGQVIQVAVYGPVQALSSTTNVATATGFSANSSGQITTASTTIDDLIVGYTLEASGTDANLLKWVWVNPTRAYAS